MADRPEADEHAAAAEPKLPLRCVDLVKKFGVSLSIVSEALGRLSSDGLVETKEMFGTRVISLDEQTLKDAQRAAGDLARLLEAFVGGLSTPPPAPEPGAEPPGGGTRWA